MSGTPIRGSAVVTASLTLVFLGLFCVFAYSGFQGDNGLIQQYRVARKEATLRVELAELRAERAAMENKNRRLSEDYLDLDLLDERARAVLGMIRADEIMIR